MRTIRGHEEKTLLPVCRGSEGSGGQGRIPRLLLGPSFGSGVERWETLISGRSEVIVEPNEETIQHVDLFVQQRFPLCRE